MPLSAGDLLRNAAVDLLRRRADAGIAEAAVLLQQYQTCLDSFMARPGPSPDTDPQTANAATVLRALACQYHDDAIAPLASRARDAFCAVALDSRAMSWPALPSSGTSRWQLDHTFGGTRFGSSHQHCRADCPR